MPNHIYYDYTLKHAYEFPYIFFVFFSPSPSIPSGGLTMNHQFFCDCCSSPCPDRPHLISHLMGAKHLKRCAGLGTPNWCPICRYWYESSDEDHLRGRRHEHALALGLAPGPQPAPPDELTIAAGEAIEMLRNEILALGGTIPSATNPAMFGPAPLGAHAPAPPNVFPVPAPLFTIPYPSLSSMLPYLPSVIAVCALIVMMSAK
jgi:hypothetical protein